MIDGAFWRGRRVLVTGHTGFKGVWLSLWLAKKGAVVFGFALPPHTSPNLFDLIDPSIFARSMFGDIRDIQSVRQAVELASPEVVIHMAAQSLVRRGYLEPLLTLETNVIGTANLLEVLRGCTSVEAILVVTTDKVYANKDTSEAYRETDSLGGREPYSASKAGAEIVTHCWARSYFSGGPNVLAARAGNVIGGGDWSVDRLVPDIWRAVHGGQILRLRCPEAVRPWQHVVEPLAGYLRYIEAASSGEVPPCLNFGPSLDRRIAVAEIADAMLDAMGSPNRWIREPDESLPEADELVLDASLAQSTIGWRPRLTSQEAVDWTAEWYRNVDHGCKATELCAAQIRRYEALE